MIFPLSTEDSFKLSEVVDNFIEVNLNEYTATLCDFYHNHPVLNLLDFMNAVYCGGYALALYSKTYFPENTTKSICEYAGDIDIIGFSENQMNLFYENLPYGYIIKQKHRTERALTLWVSQIDSEESLMLQFVHSWIGHPMSIISKFDFTNCQIAFKANTGFLLHCEIDDLIENQELNVNPDIDEYSPPNNITMSIVRAEKYCNKYNWKLNWPSFNHLMSIADHEDDYELHETNSAKETTSLNTLNYSLKDVIRNLYIIQGLQPKEQNENHTTN